MPELGTPEGEFYNPDPVVDDSVDVAAAVAAGAGQSASQQTADPNMAGAVYQPQRQNISQSVNIQSQFPQRGALELTQQDFYPGPGVAEDQYDTGLVLTPRAAQTPLGAISKAAALLQRRQQDLDKAVQDFDIYSKMGKAADPYQQNFVKVARGKMDNFVAGVADAYYKGDKKAAMRAIATNPELRTKWRQLSSELEALGQNSQFIGLRAAEYIKNAKDNKIQFDPETLKMAEELYYGLNQFSAEDGAGGDVLKQTRLNRAFEQRMSMEEFYNNDIVKGLEQSQQELSKVGITKNGNTWFMTKEGKKNFDGVIDAMAPRMADVSGITVEEAKDYLTKRLPVSITEDVHAQGIEMGRGSQANTEKTSLSGGVGRSIATDDWKSQTNSAYQKLRKENLQAMSSGNKFPDEKNDQMHIMTRQIAANEANGSIQRVDPSVIVGGQAKPVGARRYGNSYITGESFERAYDKNKQPIPGQWYVVGREVGPEMTQELMRAEQVSGPDGVEALLSTDKFKSAPVIYRRVGDVLPALNEYYKKQVPAGGTFIDVLEGSVGSTNPAPPQVQAPAAKQTGGDALGTRKKDANGQEWEKVDGGWKAL